MAWRLAVLFRLGLGMKKAVSALMVILCLAGPALARNGDGLSQWDRETRRLEAYALANQIGALNHCTQIDFTSQTDVRNARVAFESRKAFLTEAQRIAEENQGAAGSILIAKGVLVPTVTHTPIALAAANRNQSVQQWCDEAAMNAAMGAVFAEIAKAPGNPVQDTADKAYAAGAYPKALPLYVKVCDEGGAEACRYAGVMYANGEGVASDSVRSVELLSRACDGGDAGGCNELGKMVYNGAGVAADPARAASLFLRACDYGEPDGCDSLGRLYYNGEGVASDKTRAMRFYTRACDRHSADGCADLGGMYANGDGIARNDGMAADYYRRALAIDPDNEEAKKALTAGTSGAGPSETR